MLACPIFAVSPFEQMHNINSHPIECEIKKSQKPPSPVNSKHSNKLKDDQSTKEKVKKSVSFNKWSKALLIPTKEEVIKNAVSHLWWSEDDYSMFQDREEARQLQAEKSQIKKHPKSSVEFSFFQDVECIRFEKISNDALKDIKYMPETATLFIGCGFPLLIEILETPLQ